MSDWFTTAIELQRQVLDAQRASLKAGEQAVAAADTMVRMQEAGRKAAEANLAAWNSWAKLWGFGR